MAVISVQQEPFCEALELDLEHFVLAGPKCSSMWQKLSPAALFALSRNVSKG